MKSKRWVALLLSAIIIFGACPPASATGETVLSQDAVILIPENATVLETAAAERLRERLSEHFGIALEIETSSTGAFEISLGATGRIDADLSGKPDGSYVIRAYPGGVALCGAGVRGSINAVYRFLEEFGGCKVYTRDGMTTAQTSVCIPTDTNLEYTPYFEYTDTDWLSPRNEEYSLMNGLNGGAYRKISAEFGSTIDYLPRSYHTLASWFCSRDTYFKTHPEYFSLHGGVRTSDQLCLTNEDVVEIVTQEVFDLLTERHDPNVALQILSLTQDDNRQYCECPDCSLIDEANGSHAGTMITFVNRIARAVKAAGYDNVAVDTFAYLYTRKPPENVVPDPNVIIRLCPIECCYSHPLNDPTCEKNAAFLRDLEEWSRLTDRLYIWDYTANFLNVLGPFPNFHVLQANLQCFYENNVKGIYEEGLYFIDSCDTEFAELRGYQLSRLMQNPYCEIDAETDGFLKAYYGDAWLHIRSYLDRITANAAGRHMTIYASMQSTLNLSTQEVTAIDALWSSAKVKATGSALDHVLRSELSWRYWKACVGAGEFSGSVEETAGARQQLMDDLRSANVTMNREYDTNGLDDGFFYTPPEPETQTENPDNPTNPTQPTQPTPQPTQPTPQPTQPQQPQQSGSCKYCGQNHTGFPGVLIGFFHSILALFGLRK